MEQQNNNSPDIIKQIPSLTLLKVLCILTFIGSGISMLSYGFLGMFFDFFKQYSEVFPDEETMKMIEMMLSAGKYFFIVSGFLYAISLAGAILMWKFRKVGFHLYTLAQILLLILPMLFMRDFQMSIFSVLMTLLFIFAYSRFLPLMKSKLPI